MAARFSARARQFRSRVIGGVGSTRERGVHREGLSQQDRRARNSAGGRSYCPESNRRCNQWPDQRREERAKSDNRCGEVDFGQPPQKIHVLRPACIFLERATLLLRSSSLPLGHDAAPPPAAPLRVKCRAVRISCILYDLQALELYGGEGGFEPWKAEQDLQVADPTLLGMPNLPRRPWCIARYCPLGAMEPTAVCRGSGRSVFSVCD